MKGMFSPGITSTFAFILSVLAILVIAVSAPGMAQAVTSQAATPALSGEVQPGSLIRESSYYGPKVNPAANFGSLTDNGTARFIAIGMDVPANPPGPLNIYSTTSTQPETIELSGTGPLTAQWNNWGPGGASSGSGFLARFSRGTKVLPTDVLVGDRLGFNVFGGMAGGVFKHTAAIEAVVDTGTVSGTSLPTYMRFLTTPNGTTTRSERMRITAGGNVGIGTVSPTQKLHVVSTSGDAIYGSSNFGGSAGVSGQGTGDSVHGVVGSSSGGMGVWGITSSPDSYGVSGTNNVSNNSGSLGGPDYGATGDSTSGTGVKGQSSSGSGVEGQSGTGSGVHGKSTSGKAGYFEGDVQVNGKLGVSEGGASPTESTVIKGGAQTENITYTLPTTDGDSGQVLTTDGTGVLSWTIGGGSLPAGVENQTLRHDATGWVANSLLYNTGTNIGIGTTNPINGKLEVQAASGASIYGKNSSTGNNGILGGSIVGATGTHSSSGNFGYLGSSEFGAYGKNNASGNYGYLGYTNYGSFGSATGSATGVRGESVSGTGVYGTNTDSGNWGTLGEGAQGVYGRYNANNNNGYLGDSTYGAGGTHGASGNYGYLGSGEYGAYGKNLASGNYAYLGGSSHGAYGYSTGAGTFGVYGTNADSNYGYLGGDTNAVYGYCVVTGGSGVKGYNNGHGEGVYGSSMNGYGVYGHSTTNFSGYFDGSVKVNGTLVTAYVKKTADYTVNAGDSVIAAEAPSADIHIYLPATSISEKVGRAYTIKKVDGPGHNVIVDGNGLTIDGVTSKSLSAQWQYVSVVCDGANWLITANN